MADEQKGYAPTCVRTLNLEAGGGLDRVFVYEFEGPGMPQHGNSVVLWRECDAAALSRLLAKAYEAGEAAARADVRRALGIHVGPWGITIEGRDRT